MRRQQRVSHQLQRREHGKLRCAGAGGQLNGRGQLVDPAPPPPAASAKLTAPGTKLKVGQTAIVCYETALNNGKDGPSNSWR